MTIEYVDDEIVSIKELTLLYESVGWLTHAADPDALARGIDRSTYVVTARNEDGELIGLARCLSDDVSIMYLQDVLVTPPSQGAGIGGRMVEICLAKFDHVRQKVLLTDNVDRLRSFYEALGYSNVADLKNSELLAYVQIKNVELD